MQHQLLIPMHGKSMHDIAYDSHKAYKHTASAAAALCVTDVRLTRLLRSFRFIRMQPQRLPPSVWLI